MATAKEKKTVWFGMKLTPEQKDKIRQIAKKRGVSQKKAVLDLIEKEVDKEPLPTKRGSFLDGIEHLSGSVEGSGDLSTNPSYMKGFGR